MTVLRGGLLVDGTGAPPRPADVVIDGDRIAAVEAPGTVSGDSDVVDLDGLVLAPGFIDCHTHYDAQVLWDPELTPSSWHGVTTVVMGNCGFGIAPTRPGGRETIARTLENVEGMSVEALFAGIPWTFETFPEYLDAVERAGPRLNVAVMLGHTPLRLYVLGEEAAERDATPAEIGEMRHLVGEALDAGAIGFASSRQPAHAGAWGKSLAGLLRDDRTLLGLSDAGAHASQLCDAVFSTYLLEHWVRETGTLPVEKAIWRITGHPAAVFGIPGRGRVVPGYFADLVAFDPAAVGVERMERVYDLPAGADRLIARSRGLHQVWVNGEPVSNGGGDAGPRPGRLIRDGGTSAVPVGPGQHGQGRVTKSGGRRPAGGSRGSSPRASTERKIMDIPRIISVDDHVIEPAHVWQDYLPASFRDAGPRLVKVKGRLRFEPRHMAFREDPDGYWADCWSFAGMLFPVTGGFAAVSFPRDQAHNRAVLFDDILPGCYGRAARLADMDRNHTDASLCFPTFPGSAGRHFWSAATVTSRWPASGPTTTG